MAKTVEQKVIEQLAGYRDIIGRLRVLETYSVGNGITVSRLNQDDHLQELHTKLRRMPSYMYLSQKEQRLEAAAHAYLERYPTGTKAQLRAVQDCEPVDEEDEAMLEELQKRIAKVIEARTGTPEGFEAILAQLAEYQDLLAEKQQIDAVLDVLERDTFHLAKLLRLRYIEALPAGEVADQLGVVRRTFDRWRASAIAKYGKLCGMS
ncbi:RNA polymerase subunit sigma-24 [Paenibacillus alvei]|uniref:RNA polymerase subunit sigma-24 n=1 Tax=Paenibacillus alvei TaxID=44250 RepID=UPI0018CD25D0|nr:RNA polymerase subunit sigma-24 [Paenibacillus alvei]MBG9737104.1 RNA polymerase subunit sigma-24 [Paenibacillus alvei]MBG9742786.1 RNA polymerase subunit sigma-24 [Paenibacillus alvei]MBG9746197.1 RNA polymerase subunit sigma-24 [Paenibacillus alvei]MCY9579693.1 RNA polymerase subunit sigma-24 [Paenibacillus alvei]MCY9586346.1 RNA polymerase subunit sigma-24 [Paenibacillus alvei]